MIPWQNRKGSGLLDGRHGSTGLSYGEQNTVQNKNTMIGGTRIEMNHQIHMTEKGDSRQTTTPHRSFSKGYSSSINSGDEY
jgi:hypothetical protein